MKGQHTLQVPLLILWDALTKLLALMYLQGVDPRVNAALLYVGDFLPDADHSVAESVQLCLVF